MLFCALFYVHILFSLFSKSIANKYPDTRNDASVRFAGLLKDLVTLNERRFEAMKQLARLQEYSVTKYHLRSGRNFYDYDEEGSLRSPIIFVIYGGRNTVRSNHNDKKPFFINENIEPYRSIKQPVDSATSQSSEEDDDSSSPEGLTIARKSWKTSCGKKMAKHCKRACIRAYKNGCMMYRCSSRQKRNFKRECKRTCKDRFNRNKYSDYE